MTNTLVVNLFGGPGVSKSTIAALVFGKLKQADINAEIAHEYAKDLTWEERHKAIRYQPYVAGKQMWRIHRLLGQVDVVVTDSPILLSIIYKGEGHNASFENFLDETFAGWNTMNFYLERDSQIHPYNPAGRNQTEEEAVAVDRQIEVMLDEFYVKHESIRVTNSTADVITAKILHRLHEAN